MKRRLRQDLIAYIHEPREKSSKVNQRACTQEGGKTLDLGTNIMTEKLLDPKA